MTSKQIRKVMEKYSPKPGYILDLTRNQFEELFEDMLDIEVFDTYEGPSVGKTFKSFLKEASDTDIQLILNALNEHRSK